MAAPEIRGVGTVIAGTTAMSPGLPAGTEAGDLLIMVGESGGPTLETEATNPLTAEGWSAAPKSGQVKGNTRLTVLYKIAVGGDATLTNDTGNHQIMRIVGIKKGTFNAAEPFNISAGSTQAATKSVSIPGATTTVADCLILACASGHLPDATTTTEFGAATNADLTGIAEQIDNTSSQGDGGAIYAVSGVKAAAGAYGTTTCTAVTEAERGVISLAIAPLGKEVKGSATVNGGGTATASTTTIRSGSVAVQGGGDLTVSGLSERLGAAVVAGGGDASGTGSKAASAAAVVSGGGAAEATGTKEATGAATVEGGGQPAVTAASERFGAATVEGGGDATVASSRVVSQALARPPKKGRPLRGYSGSMSSGRRGGLERGVW